MRQSVIEVCEARLTQGLVRTAAARIRIIYGGSVTPDNGASFMDHDDIDGLFGRAAWSPEGFAEIAAIIARAANRRIFE